MRRIGTEIYTTSPLPPAFLQSPSLNNTRRVVFHLIDVGYHISVLGCSGKTNHVVKLLQRLRAFNRAYIHTVGQSKQRPVQWGAVSAGNTFQSVTLSNLFFILTPPRHQGHFVLKISSVKVSSTLLEKDSDGPFAARPFGLRPPDHARSTIHSRPGAQQLAHNSWPDLVTPLTHHSTDPVDGDDQVEPANAKNPHSCLHGMWCRQGTVTMGQGACTSSRQDWTHEGRRRSVLAS